MTTGVLDMPLAESEPLLNAVLEHSEKRGFVYEWATFCSGTIAAHRTRAPIFLRTSAG